MKKILILLAIMVVLTGCGEEETASNPFLGGTTGLRMNFIDDAPPAEVFDNGQFPFEIALQIENVGEGDVEDGVVTIKGIDPSEFALSESDMVLNTGELTGSSKDSTGEKVTGTITEVNIPEANYEGEVTGAELERPLVANICYDYSTKAVANICVVQNFLIDSVVCNPDQDKQVYSSGAPIQVTSFSQRATGASRTEFEFTIQNLGSVKGIYKEDSNCEKIRSLENVIGVEVTGIEGIECTGISDGYTTLIDNQRRIKCSAEIDSETDYEKAIEINLDYGISDDVSTQLTIKHVG